MDRDSVGELVSERNITTLARADIAKTRWAVHPQVARADPSAATNWSRLVATVVSLSTKVSASSQNDKTGCDVTPLQRVVDVPERFEHGCVIEHGVAAQRRVTDHEPSVDRQFAFEQVEPLAEGRSLNGLDAVASVEARAEVRDEVSGR